MIDSDGLSMRQNANKLKKRYPLLKCDFNKNMNNGMTKTYLRSPLRNIDIKTLEILNFLEYYIQLPTKTSSLTKEEKV